MTVRVGGAPEEKAPGFLPGAGGFTADYAAARAAILLRCGVAWLAPEAGQHQVADRWELARQVPEELEEQLIV
jgi:hypothetical protein